MSLTVALGRPPKPHCGIISTRIKDMYVYLSKIYNVIKITYIIGHYNTSVCALVIRYILWYSGTYIGKLENLLRQ